jgi:hypothetical protein
MLDLTLNEKETLVSLVSSKRLSIQEQIITGEWTVEHTYNDYLKDMTKHELKTLYRLKESYDSILNKLEFYYPKNPEK